MVAQEALDVESSSLDLRACQGSAAVGIVELYGGWLAERDGLVPETVRDAPVVRKIIEVFSSPQIL